MFNSDAVRAMLERYYPKSAIEFMRRSGIRCHTLGPGEKFYDASPLLRRIGARVDDWPIPPAGLFTTEDRSVILRSTSPMTVAHEFGHALDCSLGGGVYLSGIDPKIQEAYASASCFVTPYAASSGDEHFAECVRAFLGVNDPHSLWPEVSRARLAEVNPTMHGIISSLFADLEKRFGDRPGEQLRMDFAA